ncbi:unnamed protein product [Rotaria sp. Silwood1]|nr:unnamed protein product [Rotaria sp. Silwood1]CAF0857991.1 unnamed protein product [Rotaria sp. Silwood1]CAF3354836.1 unnamed protein product [Rotaria sp. Silwood1]CAF3386707.1 unnamed protein product [Rotaria sp. Silwood1]CAF4483784.1 unnamed protein product [Rotaria sp. Silwood1]
MSATTIHQSRVPKVHIPSDTTFQAPINRSNSRYKSTVHVLTSNREHSTSNSYRRRRPESETSNHPPSSYNTVSYNRSQPQQQLSSRTYQQNCPVSLSSRSSSSLSSNRRTSTNEVAPSTSTTTSASTYSSLITLNNNRSTISNPSSTINQTDCTSNQNKRYSTDTTNPSTKSLINSNNDSKTISNHLVIIPKSKSNHKIDKHNHTSCPVAYQNQINLGTITILSDSSSDNTILHHLPEHNETTDKSQQSLHDERLHRSPRKPNNNIIGSRLQSTLSRDEQKKIQIPSIHYTIEPIQVIDDINDENHLDLKQKAIREEKKRKANENEQVLINVDEYASEILMYLRKRENASRPKPNYMRKQTELTWDMRAILIDWLSEVADEYKLFSETLHLAVNFIDRFLSRMSVTKSKFQLIGTTALYLAAKCEEVYPPNAAEFAYVTDNAYTKKQVLKIEDLLLQTLHFEVSTVTTHTFLLHYLKLAQVDEVTEDLARYIAELTLLDPECLQHLSSLQAAAILCLALHMRHKPPWSNTMKQTTGYTIQSFYLIMEKIFFLVAKAQVHDKWAITRKYRHVKHHSVALIELPTTLPYTDMDSDATL